MAARNWVVYKKSPDVRDSLFLNNIRFVKNSRSFKVSSNRSRDIPLNLFTPLSTVDTTVQPPLDFRPRFIVDLATYINPCLQFSFVSGKMHPCSRSWDRPVDYASRPLLIHEQSLESKKSSNIVLRLVASAIANRIINNIT